ncbi:MAG: XisH family protein [Caldilineaceae bacterium]
MPAKDIFHDVVVKALDKDNWNITDDPLTIKFAQIEVVIDLGAEKLIGAEKGGRKIAVEIKSFLRSSAISDFHTALGQFMNYRLVLEQEEPGRNLFLAVPLTVYKDFFLLEFGQLVIERYGLKLIVYDVKEEVIDKWIE